MTTTEDYFNKTIVKAMELKFRWLFHITILLWEEFEEYTTEGRKWKTTVRMESNKIIAHQQARSVEDVREFTEYEVDHRGCTLHSGLQEDTEHGL